MNKKIGLVIMCAGGSNRFGNRNKLLESFDGTTVIEKVLSNIPFDNFAKSVLVTGSKEIIDIAKNSGIETLVNDKPELGLGRTVKMGLSFLGERLDGYTFMVCDQPLLSKSSIENLIDFWGNNSENIVSLGLGERVGNPVIFPPSMYSELAKIDDKDKGRVVIYDNIEMVKIFNAKNEYELMDIDSEEDLEFLRKHI